jgi:hypothetical protein
MSFQNGNLPTWLIMNGWREILARIFAEVETKLNVSPEWLINPATNRHLKLDLLYPELSVAVRFEGTEVKQRRQRLSLEEEAQQRVRDQARVDVCRAHGIDLILIDLTSNNPKVIFQEIDLALSRATQRIKSPDLLSRIQQARAAVTTISRQISSYSDFKLYAELWEDRQYQVTTSAPTSTPTQPTISFTPGMEVEHTTFGPGVILTTIPSGNDTLLTVDFITAGQKTLAASLVGDKLYPRKN